MFIKAVLKNKQDILSLFMVTVHLIVNDSCWPKLNKEMHNWTESQNMLQPYSLSICKVTIVQRFPNYAGQQPLFIQPVGDDPYCVV